VPSATMGPRLGPAMVAVELPRRSCAISLRAATDDERHFRRRRGRTLLVG
jgi:hypothetical protein